VEDTETIKESADLTEILILHEVSLRCFSVTDLNLTEMEADRDSNLGQIPVRLTAGLETMSITMLETYLPFSESSAKHDEKPKLGCTPRSAHSLDCIYGSLLSG